MSESRHGENIIILTSKKMVNQNRFECAGRTDSIVKGAGFMR